MSGALEIFIVVLLLTLAGSAALGLVAYKYYWGERGVPPLTRDERRLQRQNELRMRRQQIEYARAHPPKLRKPQFWDNQKR